ARQLEKFLVENPSSSWHFSAGYKLGVALFAEGNAVAAREAWQSVLESASVDGQDKDLARRRAQESGKNAVLTPVESAANKEIAPWALYLIGESYLQEKRFREAGLAYAKMAATWNEHLLAGYSLFRLAWCLRQEEDQAAAQGNLIRLIESYPNHPIVPYAQIMLGNLILGRGRVAEAARYYQEAADAMMPKDIGEAALALAFRANYGNSNYDSLVSAYNLSLNSYPPTDKVWRAWTHLYVAEGYYRRGHFLQAQEAYSVILKQYPSSPCWVQALDGLAWSLFKQGKYDWALKERERLAAMRDDERVSRDLLERNAYEKANILFNLKKYAQALEQYERFIAASKDAELLAQAKFRMGLSYTHLGYHGQAIDVWKEISRDYPESPAAPQALWNVADTYFRAAQYDQAIGHFQEHMKSFFKEGKEPQARLRIAQSYYNSRRYAQAAEAFQALILNHPGTPQAQEGLNFLTAILDMPDDRSRARETLRHVAGYFGGANEMGAQAQFFIAQSYFNNQEFARAAEDLEKMGAGNLPPERLADREYYLGESYYKENLWKQAGGAFGRLIENFPKDNRTPFAMYRLGTCYFKQDSFIEASAAFENLAQKHPASEYASGALYNAAQSYKSAQNWLKAENAFIFYIQKYPEKILETGVRETLAEVYEEQKKYALAVAQLDLVRQGEKKAEARPKEGSGVSGGKWGETTLRLAGLHVLDGQEALAMKEYEAMLGQLSPRDSFRTTAAVRLGELYEKAERWKDAVKVYETLIRELSKPETSQAARARIEYLQANHSDVLAPASKEQSRPRKTR
ncbi:MAG: tetratricopeptide repeat protein, partial [Elusimicrobia bacterium]|nr:tetratricopeptide repeat protein [Elusimicrobiota bacterium]